MEDSGPGSSCFSTGWAPVRWAAPTPTKYTHHPRLVDSQAMIIIADFAICTLHAQSFMLPGSVAVVSI